MTVKMHHVGEIQNKHGPPKLFQPKPKINFRMPKFWCITKVVCMVVPLSTTHKLTFNIYHNIMSILSDSKDLAVLYWQRPFSPEEKLAAVKYDVMASC